jgi:DNA-binding PadR family transcriptional regulator
MRNPRALALTPLALAALRLLCERPMHAYEMHRLIRKYRTDRVVKVRAGSLYHAVDRLHGAGLVRTVQVGRAGRRPQRTVYAITDAGRAALRDTVRALLRRPAEEYPVFATALHMLASVEPAEAVQLLRERAAGLAAGEPAPADPRRPESLGTEYGLAMRRAELEWIGRLVTDLESGSLTWPG